jgi:hypothetical protein
MELNDFLAKNISKIADIMERILGHKIIQVVDDKWSLVIDGEAISDLWSKNIWPYISSDPKTLIAIGGSYLITGLLIKRGVSKINSKILSSIRRDSFNYLSKPPTTEEITQHLKLCESHDKILFIMNTVETVLIFGYIYSIAPKIKPELPDIKIPLTEFIDSNDNPYSKSWLLPIFPFKKMSKRIESILIFILLMFVFIILIFYSNPYLIKIFIILTSSMSILYLFLKGFIILNYSIRRANKNEIPINKYLPAFIKKYLSNLKDISEYKNSNSFVKLYFLGGIVTLVMLIIFIIII